MDKVTVFQDGQGPDAALSGLCQDGQGPDFISHAVKN